MHDLRCMDRPPLVENRTPAPEDSFSDAAVAKTAPVKLGARVPPPPGPILKTLAVSTVDILGPPSRTASAPEALHVLRQSRAVSSSERPPTMGDKRLRPVWCTAGWNDGRQEIGKGLLRGKRATTDIRGGGDRDVGSGDGSVTWSGLRPRIRASKATSPGCGLD
ncbi:hypothetical protein HPB47_005311 [Ixodes persulcatus]|uniref:Uncharacterized protein n=1 Tax=Ixodes persulcatus TaxID=34615 RepID=A0AC60PE24_IXOPE|nr:hypothetical protein HPB47_005311 [Ixodes persulcatus]